MGPGKGSDGVDFGSGRSNSGEIDGSDGLGEEAVDGV